MRAKMNQRISLLKSFIKINLENLSGNVFKVNLAVTYKCNYKCRICNIWRLYLDEPDKAGCELDLDEIKIIFQRYNKQLIWVSLTGGEPFLRHDLTEIVGAIYENCKNLGIINIPTNGSLPNRIEKTILEIIEDFKIPLIYVTVSLDGDPARHDFMRGFNGAWARALDSLSRLHQISANYPNLSIDFEYTISPLNVGGLSPLLAEIDRYGLSNLKGVIVPAHTGNLYHNIQMQAYMSNSDRYIPTALKEIDYLIKVAPPSISDPHSIIRYLYLKLLRKYLSGATRKFFPCTAASGSCFIDPYGKVYPCIIENKVLADLRELEYDLNRAVKSNKFISFREKVEKGLCRGCWSPCEAYPSIIVHPTLSLYKSLT
ncbi:MAG: radical SAM protein [Candidatus Bathyarchaeia archaeon]|nr:radical SAM protein [Candidatus Bathyarchaeota archaeon]